MCVNLHQAVFDILLVCVQALVVFCKASIVVQEHSSCEVCECCRASAWVIALQAALDDPEQAPALHLILQVLPVAVEVPVLENLVMQENQQLS